MPSPGEPRHAARVSIVIVLLAVLVGLWWWKRQRAEDHPRTSTVTQVQRGSTSTPASPRGASTEPATLTISVTDDRGPLAGATVRLAPRDGEIVVVKTGGDGTARADHLEPGAWTVSASATDHGPAALPARQLAAGADDRLAIKLAAGGRALSGMVSDATGGPVAGARIDAARLTAAVEPGEAVSTTLTGADGKYRLTVPEGQLLVAAASPDYAPQSRYVEVGPAGAVADFSLVPGGVIEGVVRDERTKEPVAGASVVARRDSGAILLAEAGAHRATSRADGRFRLAGLGPGAWEITATDHARHSKAPTIVGIGVAEQVSNVELPIGSGPVIRGRVVDESGAPAPDVALRVVARGEGAEATADAQGAFTLEGLRPGDYVITARSMAYLPSGVARVAFGDKDVDGVVVRVRHGTALHGHVEPRQACDVQPELDDRSGMLTLTRGATTGADGEFVLGPFADGPVKLTARCASGDQGAAQVTVARGMPDTILKVAPGASIAGRVLDGDGKPVAGIVAMASNVAGTERTTIVNGMVTSGAQGLTDASGAYKLEGLSAGSYRISALDRGKPLAPRTRSPAVELAANEHKTGVDLVIDRPNGIISGTVTGPDGKPLPDAWVSAHQDMMSMVGAMRGDPGRQDAAESRMMVVEDRGGAGSETAIPPALTDAQGHYEIRGLPRATYTVVAEAQRGQLRGRATDVQPDAKVDLQAHGVTTLSGTVTGPAGPTPLFSVELDGPTRAQRSFTDGAFTFGRVDPGPYTVRVQAGEGNAEVKVTVMPDQAATLDVTLASNAVVIGKLVDGTGAPLAGQAIALAPDSGDGHLQLRIEGPPLTTGPDGAFRIEHGAGPAILVVMRSPRPFTKRGIALAAGKTIDLGTLNVDAPGPGPAPRP
jgi:protocatechuate 3,4-dioxygenase beta subunit